MISAVAAALLAQLAGVQAGPAPPDTVTLRLRFDHQYQFAGYYVADWDGLYRDAGIHVEILPGVDRRGHLLEIAEEFAQGRTDFGIMGAEALTALANDVPVTLVSPVFQRSVIRAFVHDSLDVRRPAEFADLRIAPPDGDMVSAELMAMFVADGGLPSEISYPRPDPDQRVGTFTREFIDGAFDVLPGYGLSVAWDIDRAGVDVREFNPSDYSVDFYGDALFVRSDLLETDPDLVERFAAASIEGWRRAVLRGTDVADLIAERLPRVLAVDDLQAYNRFLVSRVNTAVLFPLVPLGANSPERWDRMSIAMIAAGLIDTPVDIRDHTFNPQLDREVRSRERQRDLLLGGGIVLGLLASLILVLLVLRQRERERRLTLEVDLQRAARLESIGRLAGGLAHDFNNLLAAIKGHARMIVDRPNADNELQGDALQILTAVDRADGLIRQLLAFSKQQVLQLQTIEINEEIGEIQSMLRRLIPSEIDFAVSNSATPLYIRVDPSQLDQVIMNLVINAVDAMTEEGTIGIVIRATDLTREELSEMGAGLDPGGFVEVRVRDTGTGIPSDIIDRIFEPFFTTKAAEKGTGLGLSSLHGIVRQSGGHVDVVSEEGQGTEFRILFPRVALTAETEDTSSTPAPSPAPSGLTVLLVDDEPAIRRVTRRILERIDATVIEAASGEEALDLLDTHPTPIAVVVSDVKMPGMGGYELVRQIRKRSDDIRIILTSGFWDVDQRGDLTPSVHAFLSKPYDPQDLVKAITNN